MEKIEELTPEQEALLPAYAEKWLKIGLSSSRFTRETAERIANYYYTEIIKKPTVPVIIMDSPITAWFAVCLITSGVNAVKPKAKVLFEKTLEQVKSQVTVEFWADIEKQMKKNSGVKMPSYIHPYIDGHLYSSWFGFYNFVNEVLGLTFDCQDKYDWHQSTTEIGNFYPLDNVCVVSQKPVEVHMKDDKLHADGKPCILYADGFACWSLNGIAVPQWLAETPAGLLKPEQYLELQNADVKAEFISKFGIERMKNLGKVIDTWDKYKGHLNYDFMQKSKYELIDMGAIDNLGYTPYLGMINQTTGSYHLEAVEESCRTIPEAITKTRWGGRDFNNIKITDIK